MFYSILGKEKCEDSEKISIFTDFNLNVCISYMNKVPEKNHLRYAE